MSYYTIRTYVQHILLRLIYINLNLFKSINLLYKMDYFTQLAQRRTLQLRVEETTDSRLENTYKDCPETVLKFLLAIRKMNRIQSYELYNSGILEYNKVITNTLNQNDYLYNQYNLTNPTCQNISNFLDSTRLIDSLNK